MKNLILYLLIISGLISTGCPRVSYGTEEQRNEVPSSSSPESTFTLRTIVATDSNLGEKLARSKVGVATDFGLFGYGVYSLIKSGPPAIRSVQELTEGDKVDAFKAFKALSATSDFVVNTAYALEAGAKFAYEINYYAVDIAVPFSAIRALDGAYSAAFLFQNLANFGSDVAGSVSLTHLFESIMKTAFSGIQVFSVVTGVQVPGGALALTIAPAAISALIQYTPKVYQYYFNSFLLTNNFLKLEKRDIAAKKTYSYVQCYYNGASYWGQWLDETKDRSFFQNFRSITKPSRWRHKPDYQKVQGVWLSTPDKTETAFATSTSMHKITNSCKLPLLIAEGRVKTGRKSEIKRLFKTMPDEGITFKARDFNYIGNAYPIVYLGP